MKTTKNNLLFIFFITVMVCISCSTDEFYDMESTLHNQDDQDLYSKNARQFDIQDCIDLNTDELKMEYVNEKWNLVQGSTSVAIFEAGVSDTTMQA